ncbi:MAG TPA: hypothetical protein PK282_03810 [Rhodoglobus sp.]|nr:hypothetical protein [Rhodoglobus sp.]HPM51340.1 hypothetical protein [Rhodoglobus sp.]
MDKQSPPIHVAIIASVVWVTGAWGMIHTGRLMWRVWGNEDLTALGGTGVVITAVVIAFAINLMIISLSSALLRGSNLARVLISIGLALSLMTSIWTLATAGSDQISAIAGAIATGINAVALIGLLFFSGDHFKTSKAA